jgi:hypothetical protein
VIKDVRDGVVSAQVARTFYGVALDPETLLVDEATTADLRGHRGSLGHEIVIDEQNLVAEVRPVAVLGG